MKVIWHNRIFSLWLWLGQRYAWVNFHFVTWRGFYSRWIWKRRRTRNFVSGSKIELYAVPDEKTLKEMREEYDKACAERSTNMDFQTWLRVRNIDSAVVTTIDLYPPHGYGYRPEKRWNPNAH